LNLLDENFPEDQRPLLREWHIAFRQIGRDISHLGAKDSEIIPLMHRYGRVTFFRQDRDFFKRNLIHSAYCLVLLDVRADDTAWFVRRYLRHPRFKSEAKRMGIVARVHYTRVEYWKRNSEKIEHLEWPQN
jgi:hypothetical protein